MSDTNIVVYSGRLVEDPREINGGCKFSVASNRRYMKDGELQKASIFMPVVVWGKQAETILTHLRRASSVLVEGRLEQRTFERKDGTMGKEIGIVANNVTFLGTRKTAAEKTVTHENDNESFTEDADDMSREEGIKFLQKLLTRDK